MKSNLDQEILGTINYIKNIREAIAERNKRGEYDSQFIRYSLKWLNEGLMKLERLMNESKIIGIDF